MGQRQRVRLAGAFLHEPDVVLLDEPATSLDEAGLELLAMEMRRARADMRAVMWCVPTGVRELVENDLTLRIDGGRLVQP
jgi:ABC-type protease/lipase transport system fused ATPase/permease subunit